MIGEDNYNTYKTNQELVREKLAVAELELGMYVVELDRPWLETPFALQGFLVSSREEN